MEPAHRPRRRLWRFVVGFAVLQTILAGIAGIPVIAAHLGERALLAIRLSSVGLSALVLLLLVLRSVLGKDAAPEGESPAAGPPHHPASREEPPISLSRPSLRGPPSGRMPSLAPPASVPSVSVRKSFRALRPEPRAARASRPPDSSGSFRPPRGDSN